MIQYVSLEDGSAHLVHAPKLIFKDKMPWIWRKYGKADEYLEKALAAGYKAVIITMEDPDFEKAFPTKPKKSDVIIEEARVEKFDDLPIDPFLIDDETGEIDEMYLFRNLNEQCLKCIKACKQSKMATIIRCPLYTTTAAA